MVMKAGGDWNTAAKPGVEAPSPLARIIPLFKYIHNSGLHP